MTEAPSHPLAALAVPLAGSLVLSSVVVALLCFPPAHPSLSWHQLIALTLLYLAAAGLTHALAVWAICRVFRDQLELPPRPLILGTWISIACLPLFALLARERSLWMAFIPPIIAANLAFFLKSRTGQHAVEPSFAAKPKLLFQTADRPSLLRTATPPAAAALALQAGITTLVVGRSLTAAVLFAISIVVVIALYPLKPGQGERRSIMPATVLILLLTAIALMPFLKTGPPGLAALLAASTPPPPKVPVIPDPPGTDYSGVILFLPPKPTQKIIPPPPPTHAQISSSLAQPVVIPFDGAYWYFKQPDPRPRPNARVVKGDPIKANIRSTDFRPLSMEAHQHLGQHLPMSCCSAIRVTIRNADNRLGAIGLEVILHRTTAGGEAAESLGTLPLPSSLAPRISLDRPPVDEVLTFSFPPHPTLNQFDEITVAVKPARERSRAGAQIAVQQFVLVP